MSHLHWALKWLPTYIMYKYIPTYITTTNTATKSSMIHKKENLDRMFTQFLKISPLHSYKIHQDLQPPLHFEVQPPKGQAPL